MATDNIYATVLLTDCLDMELIAQRSPVTKGCVRLVCFVDLWNKRRIIYVNGQSKNRHRA